MDMDMKNMDMDMDDMKDMKDDMDSPFTKEEMDEVMGAKAMKEFEAASAEEKCHMAAGTAMKNEGEDGDKGKFMMAAMHVCGKCEEFWGVWADSDENDKWDSAETIGEHCKEFKEKMEEMMEEHGDDDEKAGKKKKMKKKAKKAKKAMKKKMGGDDKDGQADGHAKSEGGKDSKFVKKDSEG